MESAREARRRRILERGSDRLAFITGQSKSLPQSSDDAVGALSSTNDLDVQPDSQQKSKDSFSYESNTINEIEKNDAAPKSREENEPEILPQKVYQGSEPVSGSVTYRSVDEVVDPTISTTLSDNYERNTASADQSANQNGSSTSLKRNMQDNFSAKRINNAISASENIRLIFAITIAALVVLANRGYILGSAVASIIKFRPIFLVLLTDLTIILGWLMVNRETGAKGIERTRIPNEVYGWANLGNTMELAFVLQKVMSAIFMDCSICAVIMICGIGS